MRLRLSRLTLGEWLLGIASVALIVDVFALPWFHVVGGWWAYPPLSSVSYAPNLAGGKDFYGSTAVTPRGHGPVVLLPQANGWQSLDVLAPFILVVAALGVLVWWLTATQRSPALPASLTPILLGLSLILIVWLLVRVFLDVPGLGLLPGTHVGRESGAYVAVGLALALFAGTYRSLRREGVAEVDAVTYIETLRV
jgi:hypothetical protein